MVISYCNKDEGGELRMKIRRLLSELLKYFKQVVMVAWTRIITIEVEKNELIPGLSRHLIEKTCWQIGNWE